jgi:MFS transporter, LPLT family, lysophospholipid transporter
MVEPSMGKGFYTIMVAQFFSSLADNALFVVVLEFLRTSQAASWQPGALVPMFALFYVLLAPFLGAFADSRPKGKVMFYSNMIKVLGCCLMFVPYIPPLLAFAVVGLGAAAYSPAKYGILTELLPASKLVKANGWIEGLTILSIIAGVVLGGQLINPQVSYYLLDVGLPYIRTGIDAAIVVLLLIYSLAALFNRGIPRSNAGLVAIPSNQIELLKEFVDCNAALWRDKLGQISLATTTLFWGVSGNLRYLVLAWAPIALQYDTTQSTNLLAVVGIGTAVGAIYASLKVRLDEAPKVMTLAVVMGLLIISMIGIRNHGSLPFLGDFDIQAIWLAAPFLMLLGAIGGFLVVPMNALLQHRGHHLMCAGRSIAVQNFNEQSCILILGFTYSFATGKGLPMPVAVVGFGVLVAGFMFLIQRWHNHNLRRYPEELKAMLNKAREVQH